MTYGEVGDKCARSGWNPCPSVVGRRISERRGAQESATKKSDRQGFVKLSAGRGRGPVGVARDGSMGVRQHKVALGGEWAHSEAQVPIWGERSIGS